MIKAACANMFRDSGERNEIDILGLGGVKCVILGAIMREIGGSGIHNFRDGACEGAYGMIFETMYEIA